IFDRIDIPRQHNYLAAGVLTQNDDNVAKNYYLYRDTEGSGEWFQIAWDLDLTWGSHFMTGDNIAHDGIWADADYILGGRGRNVPISPSHPFVGRESLPANRSWNRLAEQLYSNERFAEMFRRRLRTLMDEIFAPPFLEERLAALAEPLEADTVLDREQWGQFGQGQTLNEAMDVLKNDYLAVRRDHLFQTHLASSVADYPTAETESARLPPAQVERPSLVFGQLEARPASGNQNEEFIELHNPNDFAVDLSDWKLTGGVSHRFLRGTVMEAGGSLYVVPDTAAFRSRAVSPKGGEGHLVQGNYNGQLSGRGETVHLEDRGGTAVAETTTPAQPSAAQAFLRITELHFAPVNGKSHEFIEFLNLGSSTLDLSGVHFSDGLTFRFPEGSSLGAGEIGILVKDRELFPGARVIGTFAGALNNGGETLTLRDAEGENILSFSYDGDWFPSVREEGRSLQLIDPNVSWEKWKEAASWEVSPEVGGSPSRPNSTGIGGVTYEEWQQASFTEAERADLSVSAPEADANGDGVVNLLHYAFGLSPGDQNASRFPAVTLEDGRPVLRYRVIAGAADLRMRVEVSANLTDWTPAGSLPELQVDHGDGTATFSWRKEIVPQEPRSYLRLAVESVR
ncbi:MAG: lamin tail domain-containing protein, partial [Verrucomicrobiota bacterium]